MPRCGSTLVEQIIGSGKKVISIGEETAIIENYINKKILDKQSLNLGSVTEVRNELYNIYQQKGDISTANEYWNRALQIDPSCQEAINNLEQFNTNRYDPENIPEYEIPDNNLSSSNKDSSIITSPNLTLGEKLVGGISTLLGRGKNTKR